MKKTLGVFMILLGVLMIVFAILFVALFCIVRYRGLDTETLTNQFYISTFGITLIQLTIGYLLVGIGISTMKGELSGTYLKRKIWGITLLFLGLMFMVSTFANFHSENLSVIAAHVTVIAISFAFIYFGIKKLKTFTPSRPRL